MLLTKSKAMADSLCGRKRRVPCFFWFLLLFAAGGLVLFIHQQDLSETAPHQGPAQALLEEDEKSGGESGLSTVCVTAEGTGWEVAGISGLS
ncbi:hypothetical protein PAMA_000190 [Pampus argenteus]